jgi:hypothetical protein
MKTSFALAASLIFSVAYCAPLGYCQTDAETHAAELTQTLVKEHIAWKTKISSPGAFIRAKEVERQGAEVRYWLYVSGLPIDKNYTLVSWPVTQAKPSTVMEGVSLGKEGIVICAGRTPEQCVDPSQKDGPVDFAFSPTKGEPYRIALVSKEYKASIVIVPDPISATDKGCTLSVVRLLPRFELAYFTGSGFPPNMEVSFDSQSCDEKHTIKTKTDSAGALQFAMLPFATGHSKGTTSAMPVGIACSPLIKFDWGN